jgi:hypothetical protein
MTIDLDPRLIEQMFVDVSAKVAISNRRRWYHRPSSSCRCSASSTAGSEQDGGWKGRAVDLYGRVEIAREIRTDNPTVGISW